MSILIQGQNGKLIMANRFEEVGLAEARDIKAKLERDLATLNDFISQQEQASAQPEAPQADTGSVAADQPAQPEPEQPAQLADNNAQIADAPVATAEQPAPQTEATVPPPEQPSDPADVLTAAPDANTEQPSVADAPATDSAPGDDAPLNMQ